MADCAWYSCTGSDMTAQMQRNRAESALPETSMRRRFCRASLGCALALALAAPAWAANTFNSVYISEFLAENRPTAQGSDEDYPGWIELFCAVGTCAWRLRTRNNNR